MSAGIAVVAFEWGGVFDRFPFWKIKCWLAAINQGPICRKVHCQTCGLVAAKLVQSWKWWHSRPSLLFAKRSAYPLQVGYALREVPKCAVKCVLLRSFNEKAKLFFEKSFGFIISYLLDSNVLSASPDDIDESKLDQRRKDEEHASNAPYFRRLDVADFRQRFALRWSQSDQR